MKMVSVKYFSVIVIISLKALSAEEGVGLHLKGNRCKEFNPKFVAKLSCRVRAFNHTTQLMTYDGMLHPNISITNLRVDITSYRKFGAVYRPSVIKLTEDWCAAMNGTSSHYVRLMLSSFSKYGNIIRPCPLEGSFYVRDMIIDFSKFPQFLPIGEYRMHYSGTTVVNGKEEFLGLLQDYWTVKALGVIEF